MGERDIDVKQDWVGIRTEIRCPDTIIHPRTVVVHLGDAAITDPAVMGLRRLKRLTLAAHGMAGPRLPQTRPGIRKCRLGVARERQRTQNGVGRAQTHGDALEEGDGHGRVDGEESDQDGHDGPRLVLGVHPDAVLLARPEGARPRLVVEGVHVELGVGVHVVGGGTAVANFQRLVESVTSQKILSSDLHRLGEAPERSRS